MILGFLAQKAVASSPWPLVVGGLILLVLGLLVITRPRKSGEVFRKLNQAFRPWKLGPTPVPLMVVLGCCALLMGAGSLYVAWVVLSR